MAVCRGRCPHRPAGFCAGLSVNHRVIAKPVRTLAVAIRPQGLPCLKGGEQPQAGGGIRAGKNPPVTASPCQPPLGKGAINLSDASHISPYTGEAFYSLAPPTPANLPRGRCRFPSYNRPTAHAPSARNFRRLRTLTVGVDSPSPAKWRARPCG